LTEFEPLGYALPKSLQFYQYARPRLDRRAAGLCRGCHRADQRLYR